MVNVGAHVFLYHAACIRLLTQILNKTLKLLEYWNSIKISYIYIFSELCLVYERIELHIPEGYHFCETGTKLQGTWHEMKHYADKVLGEKAWKRFRLVRKNDLDEACREHDIAYREIRISRENMTRKQFRSDDASFGEKLYALFDSETMKARQKLSMG